MKFTDGDRELLSSCIERLEHGTCAELVVVVEPRAGRYETPHWALASGFALAMLIFHLYSPWLVSSHVILADVLLAVVVVFFLVRKFNLASRLVSPRLRTRETQKAAARQFLHHRIHSTRDRTGVLVYAALAENCFDVLVDEGILARIPPEEWNEWMSNLHKLSSLGNKTGQALVAHLDKLGELLRRHLPSTGEALNQLPNVPVFER